MPAFLTRRPFYVFDCSLFPGLVFFGQALQNPAPWIHRTEPLSPRLDIDLVLALGLPIALALIPGLQHLPALRRLDIALALALIEKDLQQRHAIIIRLCEYVRDVRMPASSQGGLPRF